MKEFSI